MNRKCFKIFIMVTAFFVLSIIPLNAMAFEWNDIFKVKPAVTDTLPTASVKLYSAQAKVLEPPQISTKNLLTPPNTYSGVNDAGTLYDGNEKTFTKNEKLLWATLDAGEIKNLCKIRFLPNITDQNSANTCIGTRFFASEDNINFVELGVVEPNSNGNINLEWQEIVFSGYGRYRYFKVELATEAQFSEIEWIEDRAIKINHAKPNQVIVNCVAFDISETFSGMAVLGVYNSRGVMKGIECKKQLFTPGTSAEVVFTVENILLDVGDIYKISLFKEDLTPAILNPLEYENSKATRELSMPNLFSDNMLLQADKPLVIWGNGKCGTVVNVTLSDEKTGKVVSSQSTPIVNVPQWEVNLGEFPKFGAYTLKVSADNKELVFKNITFGDVWMCFGQSNMEYYMIMGEDTKADVSTRKGIASADNPQIRVLNLWNKGIMGANSAVDNLPLNKGETVWAEMDADHANYCSAIGYYFSQSINKKHDTPVGLLNLAVGDTEIGRWIPKDFKKNDFVSQDGDLYNNRIFPFGKLNIKGIIMYQGEADEYRTHLTAELYSDAMSAVVDKYRQIWGEDLPFYWTQITRYKSDESLVREGQRLALEKVANPKNIGMVCLLDQFGKFEGGAGNAREDIHPMGKKEVAERFLRFAERDIYSNELSAPSGPEYLSMEVVGNTVELKFKYTEALKIMPKEQYSDKQTQEYIKNNNVNTNELHEFWIAGEDDVYVPAKAVIDGGKVIVWSDEIDNPHNVRYAWGGYPQMPNLTDGSGLPTSTFSTKRGL